MEDSSDPHRPAAPTPRDARDPLAEWIDRNADRGAATLDAFTADCTVNRGSGLAGSGDLSASRSLIVSAESVERGLGDARSATLGHLAALARNARRPALVAPMPPPGPDTDALRIIIAEQANRIAEQAARIAEQEDEATTLAGILGLREKQLDDLRQENAVLNRIVAALKASLRYTRHVQDIRKKTAQAEPILGDPEWTAPMSLLPRGMR